MSIPLPGRAGSFTPPWIPKENFANMDAPNLRRRFASFLARGGALWLLAALAEALPAQEPTGQIQTMEYRGIRPTDPGGLQGLRNPERGWRIETIFAEPPGGDAWGPAHHLQGKLTPRYGDAWWILDAERYEQPPPIPTRAVFG